MNPTCGSSSNKPVPPRFTDHVSRLTELRLIGDAFAPLIVQDPEVVYAQLSKN
jgi:hypothetical protein